MLVIDSYSDQYLSQRNDGVTVMKSKIEVLKEAMEMCIAKRGIENVVAMVNQYGLITVKHTRYRMVSITVTLYCWQILNVC